jgi:predicted DNA-binding transcriptional regulator AlpA
MKKATLYLSSADLRARYANVSLMTIYRWLNAGKGFPQPVKMSGRNYWLASELDEYDQRIRDEAIRARATAA